MSERITTDPDVLYGEPCIRKTGIPVYLVARLAETGMSTPEIIEAYPELEPEDVQAAVDHVANAAKQLAALARVEAWVRETLEASGECAHGWLHVDRVRENILVLACSEEVDPFLAELAGLLHDVGRARPGPESEHGARSAAMAAPVLAELPLTDGDRETVLHAIRWHNSLRADTALLRILRDADMLDGLGAIGIIRAFMSRSHLPPYDPDDPFGDNDDRWPALYSSDQLLGQMAWYDKLNTDAARQLAKERINLMKIFIAQARRELWDDNRVIPNLQDPMAD